MLCPLTTSCSCFYLLSEFETSCASIWIIVRKSFATVISNLFLVSVVVISCQSSFCQNFIGVFGRLLGRVRRIF